METVGIFNTFTILSLWLKTTLTLEGSFLPPSAALRGCPWSPCPVGWLFFLKLFQPLHQELSSWRSPKTCRHQVWIKAWFTLKQWSPTQSYQAHNPAGSCLLPGTQNSLWKDVYPVGQNTRLGKRPRRTGSMCELKSKMWCWWCCNTG